MILRRLLFALALAAAVPRARAAELAPLPDSPRAWTTYAHGPLLDAFPALSDLAPPVLPNLQRVLAETTMTPAALKKVDTREQVPLIERTLSAYAKTVAARARRALDPQAEPMPLDELSDLRDRLGDLTFLFHSRLLPGEDVMALSRLAPKVGDALDERTGNLIREKAKLLAGFDGVEWQGRTAFMRLEDGSALAFKTSGESEAAEETARRADVPLDYWNETRPSRDLLAEAESMERSRRLGMRAPMTLTSPSGARTLLYAGPLPEQAPARGRDMLVYFLPKALAEDYRTYLNQALPSHLSLEEKAAKIERGALRAIEDMAVLLQHGYAHASLAPLSHRNTHWEWDYWRWVWPFFAKMRFGPSSIHDWEKELAYPNLRLSGLADFEHIEPLSRFQLKHRHTTDQHVVHDAYSFAVGQNLAEWALVALHAGIINGLSNARTSEIVLRGLELHARRLLPAAARSLENERFWIAWDIRSTGRRMRLVAGLMAWPPARRMVDASLALVRVFAPRNTVNESSASLPGWAVHPLIMRVLAPYVEMLRRHEAIGRGSKDGHPVDPEPDTDMQVILLILGTVIFGAGPWCLLNVLAPAFMKQHSGPMSFLIVAPLLAAWLLHALEKALLRLRALLDRIRFTKP